MLTGGVITSMALPWADFERFTAYKQGVFLAMNELQPGTEGVMHAVFCYGWWDDPRSSSDGYWLCKNRWAAVTAVAAAGTSWKIATHAAPAAAVHLKLINTSAHMIHSFIVASDFTGLCSCCICGGQS